MYRVIISKKQIKGLSNIFCATELDPSNVIDETTTGVSYYDDFLDPKELKYLQNQKNRTGEVVMMSPNQYYEECATKVFNSSVYKLKGSRNSDKCNIEYLTKAINSKRKFQMPYINYADVGQEGLHRMMVLGDAFGWDTEFPVLVVTAVDERKDIINEAYKELRRAVDESVQYQYSSDSLCEDLISQIQWELDKDSFADEAYDAVLLKETSDSLFVSLKGFEKDFSEEIDKSELRLRESSNDDFEVTWDDLDVEDLDIDWNDVDSVLKAARR